MQLFLVDILTSSVPEDSLPAAVWVGSPLPRRECLSQLVLVANSIPFVPEAPFGLVIYLFGAVRTLPSPLPLPFPHSFLHTLPVSF